MKVCFHEWRRIGDITNEDIHVFSNARGYTDSHGVDIEYQKECLKCKENKKVGLKIIIDKNGDYHKEEYNVTTFMKVVIKEAQDKYKISRAIVKPNLSDFSQLYKFVNLIPRGKVIDYDDAYKKLGQYGDYLLGFLGTVTRQDSFMEDVYIGNEENLDEGSKRKMYYPDSQYGFIKKFNKPYPNFSMSFDEYNRNIKIGKIYKLDPNLITAYDIEDYKMYTDKLQRFIKYDKLNKELQSVEEDRKKLYSDIDKLSLEI